MGCSPSGYKITLVSCNVALLFVGLSVFVLGIKMKSTLTALLIIDIPIIQKAVEAVIVTGFFIASTGTTGIYGACYESLILLIIHLLSLGVIVILEFSLGVTLVIVKKTIDNTINSEHCNAVCGSALDAFVLDYALPSTGLMMIIISVEALMIYSSVRLYFHIRDRPKTQGGNSIVLQNVPTNSFSSPQHAYPQSVLLYDQSLEYMLPQEQVTNAQQPNATLMVDPPEYYSLPPQQQQYVQQRQEQVQQSQQAQQPQQELEQTDPPAYETDTASNLAMVLSRDMEI